MNKRMRKILAASGVASFGATVGTAMAATPTTVAELASSVSLTDVAGGILAVAGVVITLYVTWKGAKFVIAAVRGA